MKINPFENEINEYNLSDVLEIGTKYWSHYTPKKYYQELFKIDELDYELLIKCINTKINWHIFRTGSYQGDYWYFAVYNKKIYFVNIGYGTCCGCDELMACEDSLKDLIDLQNSIKSNIREFNNFNELINWITNSTEWWLDVKDEVINYIKKEFNLSYLKG